MKTTATIIAAAAIAAPAIAGVTTTDPGRYDLATADSLVEARARVDNGNSQTWKTAFWSDGSTLASHSGIINPSPWVSGQAEQFSFTYDAATGDATWSVIGRNLTDTFVMDPADTLAGFYFSARSNAPASNDAGGSVLADNLMVSVDGQTAQAITGMPSFGIDTNTVYADSALVFFTEDVASFTITGDVTFNFAGSNAKNDRYRFSVRPVAAELIPTPGAATLTALAAVAGLRRRRA